MRRGGQAEHTLKKKKIIMNMCGEKTKIKASKKPVLTCIHTWMLIKARKSCKDDVDVDDDVAAGKRERSQGVAAAVCYKYIHTNT